MFLIHDQLDNVQRFPLNRLLEEILKVSGKEDLTRVWMVQSARGYGLDVCLLEDSLDAQNPFPIPASDLLRISKDQGQWFYDLRCADPSLGVEFGMIDSSALFIGGNDAIAARVSRAFENVAEV